MKIGWILKEGYIENFEEAYVAISALLQLPHRTYDPIF